MSVIARSAVLGGFLIRSLAPSAADGFACAAAAAALILQVTMPTEAALTLDLIPKDSKESKQDATAAAAAAAAVSGELQLEEKSRGGDGKQQLLQQQKPAADDGKTAAASTEVSDRTPAVFGTV